PSNARGVGGDRDNTSSEGAGAVYLYQWGEQGWQERAYVKPANTRGGDRFGSAIGLSTDGSQMAVGAYREPSNAVGVNGDREDTSAPSAGAVYLYLLLFLPCAPLPQRTSVPSPSVWL